MLRKSQRLNLSSDFKKIATSGKRVRSLHFSGFYIYEGKDVPKIGIALAKKEFRKSHQRNRARRLLATALQLEYPRLSKGLNLVMMPKSEVLNASVEELRNEISSLVNLYKAN